MSIFEATMLTCFGISWPVSITKSLRTKTVRGKSPLFMSIVCLGYMSGVIHKIVYLDAASGKGTTWQLEKGPPDA